MSRRPPSDTFTRFTSHNPQSAQNPTSFGYTSPQTSAQAAGATSSPSGHGETPQQKVARLRALARAQKESQLSGVDKVVAGGRRWADVAHRATTYTLLGLTGVSAVIGLYSLVSLVTYSRRQKRAFIEKEMDRLRDAQQAFLRGEANAEQLHLLEQERAGEEIATKMKSDKEQKKSEGVWSRMKGMVGRGAASGEMGSETPAEAEARALRRGGRQELLEGGWIEGEVKPVAVAQSEIQGVGYDEKGRPVPLNKVQRVVRKVEEERHIVADTFESKTRNKGGPLDIWASNAASTVSPNSNNSWLSWIRGSGT